MCAAAKAAEDEGGSPARSAAEEAGIPGGSPKHLDFIKFTFLIYKGLLA